MRAMVVREYRKAPVVSEVADPAGPAADVLAASLNPVDLAVAAGLNPFRRPKPPLVLGMDGVAGPTIRKDGISILTYAIFTSPTRERSDAFARLAEHAAAGELTVECRETGLEALPAIWDDFAAGRAQTKIIVKPNETAPS